MAPEPVATESADCFDEQTVIDLVAGRLSETVMVRVEQHLSSCEACTDLLRESAPMLGRQRGTPTLRLGSPVGPADAPRAAASDGAGASEDDDPNEAPRRRRPALQPGTVLRETYQIIRRIGQGGMGDVYEAKHARLTGRYAVKVLPAEFALNVAVLSRFRREAQIASGLQHPNIVQVIDFHETDDGTPYLVMEYLDGEDLAAMMARRGAMPLADAMPIIEQIGDALTAVHRRGIVHRDVKPQNVFLIPAEHGRTLIKLVDFGLSKAHAPSLIVTRQPMLLGTPQYMAPEQALARDEELGPATDQFALAAIVYQMLSGRPPFAGDRISSVLYQIVHEDPPPLGPGAADARVEAVLRRALSKAREERFPSLAEFVEALKATPAARRAVTPAPADDDAATGQTEAREAHIPTWSGRSRSRRAWVTGLAAVAVLAGAAIFVLLRPPPAGVGPAPAATAGSTTTTTTAPTATTTTAATSHATAPAAAGAGAPTPPSPVEPPAAAGAAAPTAPSPVEPPPAAGPAPTPAREAPATMATAPATGPARHVRPHATARSVAEPPPAAAPATTPPPTTPAKPKEPRLVEEL
jgi:serine/threonine-protein kinase